jgi:hypothetical protein
LVVRAANGSEAPPIIDQVIESFDGVSATIKIPREELDLHWISFDVLAGTERFHESSCLWNHCNSGNTWDSDQNGDESSLENDDMESPSHWIEIDPDRFPPEATHQVITFKVLTPYSIGTDQACVRVGDSFGTMAQRETRSGACPSTEEVPAVTYPLQVRQNSPNPFSSYATYAFNASKRERVRMGVYNQQGRCVATFFDGEMDRGPHEVVWNGLDEEGRRRNSP